MSTTACRLDASEAIFVESNVQIDANLTIDAPIEKAGSS